MKNRGVTILGIETSCDDTCMSVVRFKDKKFQILSNIVSSQVKLHAKYGGVYPFLAKREHKKNLALVFKKAMEGIKNIDKIAVTVGPGLEPCLWTGINFAESLSLKLKKEIIPVNHIEAHILSNFINKEIPLPAIALIVSGGHTELILVKKIGQYKILGETRDDAAGECFDKVARILKLPYPGGPNIAKEAEIARKMNYKSDISLPRPMIKSDDYDFSFSGLKTAVLYLVMKSGKLNKKERACFARETEQSIIDVLIKKTLRAARDFKVKSVLLGGGVSANKELRKQFEQRIKEEFKELKFFVPEPYLSTDNAVMTAVSAFFSKNKGLKLEAKGNLRLN